MKILCIHAHFDDFEFVVAGTFELWRKKLGSELKARVIVCTDGQAGHHFRPRQETGRIRLDEQLASARVGGYEFEQLKLPNGEPPREACVQVDTPLLAALWRSIREFEPDYLFCPPLPSDPLAGIHVDHVAVAEAVRRVAYMINVPHAFTPEYPADETRSRTCKVPVIMNVHDSYMGGANAYDLAVDVEEAFAKICEMSWCHQSQITEWLPWVGRHDMEAPKTPAEWSQTMRKRFENNQRKLGILHNQSVGIFQRNGLGNGANDGADCARLSEYRARGVKSGTIEGASGEVCVVFNAGQQITADFAQLF